MLPLIKAEGGGHVVRQEADLHFRGDELHGDVIGHPIYGHGGILTHLPGNAIQETLFQPLPGLLHADGRTGLLVASQGRSADAGMDRCIIRAHVVLKEPIELCQGSDGVHVQRIEPCLLERPELALNFCFRGTITDLRV